MTLLSSIGAFENLTKAELGRLEQGLRLLEPRDGAEIFGQGDAADAVYAIVGGIGRVRIGAADRRSKALMVEVFLSATSSARSVSSTAGPAHRRGSRQGQTARGPDRRIHVPEGPRLMSKVWRSDLPHLARRLSAPSSCFRMRRSSGWTCAWRDKSCIWRPTTHDRPIKGCGSTADCGSADLADLLGATTRSIITILNSWRSANIVLYDTDRALLTVADETALRAIIDADT